MASKNKKDGAVEEEYQDIDEFVDELYEDEE